MAKVYWASGKTHLSRFARMHQLTRCVLNIPEELKMASRLRQPEVTAVNGLFQSRPHLSCFYRMGEERRQPFGNRFRCRRNHLDRPFSGKIIEPAAVRLQDWCPGHARCQHNNRHRLSPRWDYKDVCHPIGAGLVTSAEMPRKMTSIGQAGGFRHLLQVKKQSVIGPHKNQMILREFIGDCNESIK